MLCKRENKTKERLSKGRDLKNPLSIEKIIK